MDIVDEKLIHHCIIHLYLPYIRVYHLALLIHTFVNYIVVIYYKPVGLL